MFKASWLLLCFRANTQTRGQNKNLNTTLHRQRLGVGEQQSELPSVADVWRGTSAGGGAATFEITG